MVAVALATVGLIAVLFGQINPAVDGPSLMPSTQLAPSPAGPSSSTTSGSTTTNVTNIFPPPDPEVVVETQRQAAPVILDSGFRSLDSNGGATLSEVFNLGLSLSRIREDLILTPVVQDLNAAMVRIVLSSLGLVIAALALWGIMGEFVGSDSREAIEYLIRVPLWCVMALTSLQWFGLVMRFFAALAGLIATSSHGAFGATMREDFWSNVGLGLFALFIGLFYLLNLLLFALQLFANTGFLAFAALSAPVFVFLKTTPWTARWGDNWLRMVPATAADLLAMMAILVVGAEGLNRIDSPSAFTTIAIDLGLLLSLPLIRRLFGLEGNSAGGRLFGMALLARTIRSMRSPSTTAASATRPATTAPAPSTSATSPTRAPRWTYTGPATNKRTPWTAGQAA